MSFETWFIEDDHDIYNFPEEAMKEAFEAGKKEAAKRCIDLREALPDTPKHHCQNGTVDVCLAGAKDGICCPDFSCDIDDGIRT